MKLQKLVFCGCESVILLALLCNTYQNFYVQCIKARYFLFKLVFCGCGSIRQHMMTYKHYIGLLVNFITIDLKVLGLSFQFVDKLFHQFFVFCFVFL